ncbi:MAG TPA: DEAD/DEAH box helicase [Polyangia bacterium]
MSDQVMSSSPAVEPSEATGIGSPKTTFADLGLRPEVLKAVSDMGFVEPMDVQRETIPMARKGHDILVQSRTGSGKTAAFAIPFADWIADPKEMFPQALVLLPTRELALQVAAETARICATTELAVVPVYGGSPMGRQIEQLRAGAQVICGTPGRTLDHIRRGTLKLDRIKCVVLDECDEMLSMGFQEDIENILSETPPTRQTLLFSATIPEGIQRLSRRFMHNPETLKLSADFVGVHEIRHTYYSIPGGQREAELLRVLAFEDPTRAVIFCNTRDETGRVAEHLRRQGLNAEPISSDLSQSEREDVMQRMRAGSIRFLVATDVAARGIDIENLPCVINYTFPESPEIYIHRTGRTGRAGRNGHAISLIGPTEVGSFYYLKLLYKIKPDERTLPSEAEVRSHREGERLLHLRSLLPGDPGPEWHSLARRLMVAVDAERLVGSLLRSTLAGAKIGTQLSGPAARPTADIPPIPTAPTPASRTSPPADHSTMPAPTSLPARDARPARDAVTARDAVPAGEADRHERGGHGERRPRSYGDRPRSGHERGPRERDGRGNDRPAQAAPAAPAAAATTKKEDGREFWEVWSEEVGRTPTAESTTAAATTVTTTAAPAASLASPSEEQATSGQARLYVNLGRKDGATADLVSEMLSSSGVVVPATDVELMNTHSYVNVARDAAEALCAAMNGKSHNNRAVVCEPARPPKRRT